MSLSKTSPTFCVFCYRNNNSLVNNESKNTSIKRFVKLVGRFVYTGKHNRLCDSIEEIFALEIPCDNLWNSCEDCKLIIESFCETYHELKCLEMKLEWKLDKLGKIIKQANMVPSRLSQVNKVLDEFFKNDKENREKCHRSMNKFRKSISKAGNLKQKNSQPRVLLTTKINSLKTSVLPTTQENINHDIDIDQQDGIPSDSEQYFDEFSNQNDEYVDIAVSIDSDIGNQQQTSTENLNSTISKVSPEEIGETDIPISIIPTTSTVYIDNIILNTIPTNDTNQNEHVIKIELGQQFTEHDERTPPSDNLEDNLTYKEAQQEGNEQKINRELADNIRDENFKEFSSDNTTASTSASNQQRYSLRKKGFTKLKNQEKTNNHDNANDNDYTMSEISFAAKPKRGQQRPNFKTQLERLKKHGHIVCCSDGCQVRFQTEESYTSHLKYHQTGNYPCQFCSIVETSLVKLSFHEYRTHSNANNLLKDKPRGNNKNAQHLWSCPRCPNKSLDSGNKYLSHYSFTHFGIGKVPSEMKPCEIISGFQRFRCKFCKFPFTTKKVLGRHIREQHQPKFTYKTCDMKTENDQTEQIAENFSCKFCDSKWQYASDLAVHETEHALPKLTTEKMTKKNALKTSKCPRCPFLYTQQTTYIKHHLKDHLKLLSGDYPGACKMCSGPEVYVPNRKKHYDRFHNTALLEEPSKVFKCDYAQCTAYFLNAVQLYKHKNTIHLRNNHKCDICNKVFKTRHKLMCHMRAYHKNFDENPSSPLACDRDGCPKRFKSEGELELHKIFHAHSDRRKDKCKDGNVDKRALVCSECGKVCKSSLQLTFHQKNVHGERKFVCQECGKSFKTKNTLIIHLEYHKGRDDWKFECKECGKKYVDKYKLASHMNTHTKEKPWICQFCGEKYAHRHNWRNHLKVKHGDEEGAQEDIRGKFFSTGVHLSRKGSKKGDCIVAGVTAEETGLPE